MSGLAVLQVTRSNVGVFANVADDVFDAEVSPSSVADYLNAAGHGMFVAVRDETVIGQIRGVVHKQPDGAPHLYIDNLGVAPAEQRQGLGRILLVSLLAWGKQYGCELCWVATETDNAQALAFYAATGFEQKTLAWLEIDLTSL